MRDEQQMAFRIETRIVEPRGATGQREVGDVRQRQFRHSGIVRWFR
jgi:hypothetical protein